MHEDWMLDENFNVESGAEFYSSLNADDQEFALKKMIPCANCGEFRPKDDPDIKDNGWCHLCNISPEHARRRGMSKETSETTAFLARLVKELRELTQ